MHTLPDKTDDHLASFFRFRTRLESAIVKKEKRDEKEEGKGKEKEEGEASEKREVSGRYRGDVRGMVGEVRVGVRLDALYNVAQFLFPEKKSRKDRQRLQNAKKHLDIQEEEERYFFGVFCRFHYSSLKRIVLLIFFFRRQKIKQQQALARHVALQLEEHQREQERERELVMQAEMKVIIQKAST